MASLFKTVGSFIAPKDANIETHLAACKGRGIGIELELEGVLGYDLPPGETAYNILSAAPSWGIKRDNSLRNHGAEFISFPSDSSSLHKNLIALFALPKSKMWKVSSRTGLHVHVNVRDFTWEEIRSLVVAYCLLEPAMFGWVGKEREENIFCIPYYRTPKTVLSFSNLHNNDVPLKESLLILSTSWCKYTALHLAPVARLGTVEFRHAPSWLDPHKICDWALLCERLVSYAKDKAPKDIIKEWEEDWMGFMNHFTWVPDYNNVVQRLDSDLLANVIAGVEVSDAAWNQEFSNEVPDEWYPKPITKAKKYIPPVWTNEPYAATPSNAPKVKTVPQVDPVQFYNSYNLTSLLKQKLDNTAPSPKKKGP